MRILTITGLVLFLASATSIEAADGSRDLFESRIRPLLIKHCLACHGPKKQESGLRLDSRSGWVKGGDRGTSIVPGKARDSLLIKAVSHVNPSLKMPPAGKLSTTEIADLSKWVRLGAFDPRTPTAGASSPKRMNLEQARDFWSLQPIVE